MASLEDFWADLPVGWNSSSGGKGGPLSMSLFPKKGNAIDRAMEVLTGLLHSVVGNAFHVQPFPTAFL
jgi:hypothetical protein